MNKFSIIIAVYNGASTIKDSIDSIFKQDYRSFELIIIDDASTDGTSQILEEYKDNPRVKIIRNSYNLERSASRNIGINVASGEYVTFLDADDYYLSGRLGRLSSKVQGFDFIYHSYFLLSKRGMRLYKTGKLNLNKLLRRNRIGLQSVALKREFIIQNNLYFDETLNSSEDYDLWLRCFHHGRTRYCNEALTVVRKEKDKEINDYRLRTTTHLYVKLRFMVNYGMSVDLRYLIFDIIRMLMKQPLLLYRFRRL